MVGLSAKILWTVRAALVLAVGFSVVFSDLPQFEGKGMLYRAPFYLSSLAVVPGVVKFRRSPPPYPYLADALIVAPFLTDTLGNAFGFYDSFEATDDVLHFINWVLLVGGITLGLIRTNVSKLNAWALAYGIGGLLIIWWEVLEYWVQLMGTAGLQLTYEDTIGDLLLSSTGGAVGAALVIWAKPSEFS